MGLQLTIPNLESARNRTSAAAIPADQIMSQMVPQGDSNTDGGAGGGGEQRAVQSNIKKDERFDVRWEGMPFKYRKIGRGPKATYEKVCIMPLWLRNLWPTSEFDPCAVWEQAKEEEAEDAVKEKAAAASGKPSKSGGGKGGGGGGSKKGGGGAAKLSKKETIQADQARKRTEVSPGTGHLLINTLYSLKYETSFKKGRLRLRGKQGTRVSFHLRSC